VTELHCACVTECGLDCHKKCEKFIPNLCGVNQKILAELLDDLKLSNKVVSNIFFKTINFVHFVNTSKISLLAFFLATSARSALEILAIMRYINLVTFTFTYYTIDVRDALFDCMLERDLAM